MRYSVYLIVQVGKPLLLGLVLAGLGAGIGFAVHGLVPGVPVVLVAVAIGVVVVLATFFGTQWAGRRLGVSEGLSLLVATGFSICGVSAIAAARDVTVADEEEV